MSVTCPVIEGLFSPSKQNDKGLTLGNKLLATSTTHLFGKAKPILCCNSSYHGPSYSDIASALPPSQ